jgi:hypothetical protein
MREKASKDKSVCFATRHEEENPKKRKRCEFERKWKEDEDDEESTASCIGEKQSTTVTYAREQHTKQRHIDRKAGVLWLRMLKTRRMRKPFPLYNDSDIFKCASKEV